MAERKDTGGSSRRKRWLWVLAAILVFGILGQAMGEGPADVIRGIYHFVFCAALKEVGWAVAIISAGAFAFGKAFPESRIAKYRGVAEQAFYLGAGFVVMTILLCGFFPEQR